MKQISLGLALWCGVCFSGASLAQAPKSLSQSDLAEFAQKTEFRFGVITNFGQDGMQAHIVLHNQSKVALPAGEGNWRIYFH